MNNKIFEGNLVRLIPLDPEKDSEKISAWGRDSEYQRLFDSSAAALFSPKLVQSWFEQDGNHHSFMIQALEGERTIGEIELGGFDWSARSAWVGIGIGERDFRGKGFGTDAMNVLLRYAFAELNLHRVNLNVFSFNRRAIRSYEKAGFKYEGAERERIFKEDRRWDIFDMGILRSDWELLHQAQPVSVESVVEMNA